MSKNKSLDSFNGFTYTEKQIDGQENIATLENGKYMPPKKKGRPIINRELKKRYSFTILPSLYEQTSKIASNEGKSLSELITDFMTEYIKKHN